mgnify:CR=1 FL=1
MRIEINNLHHNIMKRIVLVRHGESAWNLENRFTGWTDVDLTPKGNQEAIDAGKLLKAEGFTFSKAYTSYLKRAVKTLNNILDNMDLDWIPVEKSWRLNEKHYGNLQGLNKAETAEKYGDAQVKIWRRSYDVAPLPLAEDDPRNPKFDPRYAGVADSDLPRTESLKDAIALAEYLNRTGRQPEQVQDFYPTPGTVSTCMYHTGLVPRTMQKVFVTRNPHEKAMQRALLQTKDPKNYDLIKEALEKTGRTDLIGSGPGCLIPEDKKQLMYNRKRGRRYDYSI